MSQVYMKKMMNDADSAIPKVISYMDSWPMVSRGLIFCHLKFHSIRAKKVIYLCYSHHPRDYNILSDYFQASDLKLVDVYSNPLNWHNQFDHHKNGETSFMKLLESSGFKDNQVVVIERLDAVAKYVSEHQILQWIHELKNDSFISQVILNYDQDLISNSFKLALDYISSAVVTLSSDETLCCNLLWKKKSGKVIKSNEEFSLNSNFDIQMLRLKPEKEVEMKEENSDLTHLTTFNLSLTEDQKAAKERVVLPHTRIQNQGGQIHYVPDQADEWDDEDPDDDLDI